MKKIYIFGCSGFSREVADICLEIGYTEIVFVDSQQKSEDYFGFSVLFENDLQVLNLKDNHFAIGIGEPLIRKKIYEKFPNLIYPNLVHSTVTFGYKQREALNQTKGNILCAGTRITNNTTMGNFGIYNLNVTVGHDCIIEDFVTISPGANISGNVEIKDGAYIGTGSTVLQGKSIEEKMILGERSTVGAGAVVVKNVAPNIVVKGTPAK